MKLKLFTVALLGLAVATTVALTGCKSEETTTTETPEVTTPVGTTETTTEAVTTTGVPAEGTTETTTTTTSTPEGTTETTTHAPAEEGHH